MIANLKARREHLRSSLASSQEITDQVCRILDGFDEKTAQLEELMLPVQEKVQTLSRAHDNLDATVLVLDSMLHHFEISREVEGQISEGPRGDFTAYLQVIDQLDTAMNFMEEHSAEKTTAVACKITKELRYQGLLKCEEGFRTFVWEYADPLQLPQVEAQFLHKSQKPTTAHGDCTAVSAAASSTASGADEYSSTKGLGQS
eukprot:CAMPEP_0197852844 /NCGR_PEP_ID=MMETSP1438-20131217/21537_1 /TAXON_ID=1461541 /ORGANISM="Pterosperma sp., Strain CCMP1384" /LENGTH=201 /DNA_ID=CAMNT_0043467045 /DNA_START=145 /DNA_END=746 /DNA_ORIENTATION=+